MQRKLRWLVEVVPLLVLAGCSSSQTSAADADSGADASYRPACCGGESVTIGVDAASVSPSDGGPIPAAECEALCADAGLRAGTTSFCMLVDAGALLCDVPGAGRRPSRFTRAAPRRSTPLGEHFARAAQLEAASIDAFRILRRELLIHGAPARLVHAASRAAADERRHTRASLALAARYGGAPAAIRVDRAPEVRTLEAIALENAVEGCVRETYGAMEAAYQARAAQDPVVRDALQRIARDEARHASLAWSVDAWARGRLTRAARARVDQARADALSNLSRQLASPRVEALHAVAGLPRVEAAKRLLAAMA